MVSRFTKQEFYLTSVVSRLTMLFSSDLILLSFSKGEGRYYSANPNYISQIIFISLFNILKKSHFNYTILKAGAVCCSSPLERLGEAFHQCLHNRCLSQFYFKIIVFICLCILQGQVSSIFNDSSGNFFPFQKVFNFC